MKRIVVVCVTGLAIAALAVPSAVLAKATNAAAAPKKSSVEAGGAGSGNLSGKVVETMDAGGYTYVCLEKKGTKTWVAVPQMKVTKGSTLSFEPGAVMPNFTSKTLNRTFESIVFSPGPSSAAASGGSAMPPGHPSLEGSGASGGSKAQVLPKSEVVKVDKAAGANGFTVSEIYAKRSSLDKKTVVVRGKVVKVNRGIMNRNWIHLQDGTGDAKKGTHNLVATSQDEAAVGDVVTATGTFAKDKDFGGGYLYKAIIEDAKITK